MKLSELVLIFILAIVLSISKISSSLQDEKQDIVGAKTQADSNILEELSDTFKNNEIKIAFNKQTQEIIFLDNSKYTKMHFSE